MAALLTYIVIYNIVATMLQSCTSFDTVPTFVIWLLLGYEISKIEPYMVWLILVGNNFKRWTCIRIHTHSTCHRFVL